jgi:hypothetical protein
MAPNYCEVILPICLSDTKTLGPDVHVVSTYLTAQFKSAPLSESPRGQQRDECMSVERIAAAIAVLCASQAH